MYYLKIIFSILSQVSLKIVDENPGFVPAVVKDKFWCDTIPEPLYSSETAHIPQHPPVGSAVGMVFVLKFSSFDNNS